MSSESEVEKPEIIEAQEAAPEKAPPQDKLQRIFKDVTKSFPRARSDLKEHFLTKMLIEVFGRETRFFLFNPQTPDSLFVEVEERVEAETHMRVHYEDLMRLLRGQLNPQVGMLSGRLKVTGRFEPAIYFFNLFESLD